MSLAGLGAFAGGAAAGMNNGARIAGVKNAIDTRKLAQKNQIDFNKFLQGIMSNDPDALNIARNALGVPYPSQERGYQSAPVAPMGQAEPQGMEPGLGTL
jgi:hypothetical protein